MGKNPLSIASCTHAAPITARCSSSPGNLRDVLSRTSTVVANDTNNVPPEARRGVRCVPVSLHREQTCKLDTLARCQARDPCLVICLCRPVAERVMRIIQHDRILPRHHRLPYTFRTHSPSLAFS